MKPEPLTITWTWHPLPNRVISVPFESVLDRLFVEFLQHCDGSIQVELTEPGKAIVYDADQPIFREATG